MEYCLHFFLFFLVHLFQKAKNKSWVVRVEYSLIYLILLTRYYLHWKKSWWRINFNILGNMAAKAPKKWEKTFAIYLKSFELIQNRLRVSISFRIRWNYIAASLCILRRIGSKSFSGIVILSSNLKGSCLFRWLKQLLNTHSLFLHLQL